MKKPYILKAIVTISIILVFLLPVGIVLADPLEQSTTEVPELNVEFPIVQRGFGAKVSVKNIGDADATDVQVTLAVRGGLLGRIDQKVSETIPCLAVDEEVIIQMERIDRLSWIVLGAYAECAEGSSDADRAIGAQYLLFYTVAFSLPFDLPF